VLRSKIALSIVLIWVGVTGAAPSTSSSTSPSTAPIDSFYDIAKDSGRALVSGDIERLDQIAVMHDGSKELVKAWLDLHKAKSRLRKAVQSRIGTKAAELVSGIYTGFDFSHDDDGVLEIIGDCAKISSPGNVIELRFVKNGGKWKFDMTGDWWGRTGSKISRKDWLKYLTIVDAETIKLEILLQTGGLGLQPIPKCPDSQHEGCAWTDARRSTRTNYTKV
jgi:hypothetical protein